MTRIINKYQNGRSAEKAIIEYIKNKLQYSFIHWPKKRKRKKNPEGFILYKKKKIAVIKIKRV